jgi:hypothetical protein
LVKSADSLPAHALLAQRYVPLTASPIIVASPMTVIFTTSQQSALSGTDAGVTGVVVDDRRLPV